jgi:hypothetical protein
LTKGFSFLLPKMKANPIRITVKPKLQKLALLVAFPALVAGWLTVYSYRRLLALERLSMPDLASLHPPCSRSLQFNFCDPWACYLPHWTLSYPESQVTDLAYITPSITVDIFGRLAGTTSKDVYMGPDLHY